MCLGGGEGGHVIPKKKERKKDFLKKFIVKESTIVCIIHNSVLQYWKVHIGCKIEFFTKCPKRI